MYRVNVSSVNDFASCRFRWWAKWIMNRVPVAESPALDAGRLLHRAFEDHFENGTPLGLATTTQCKLYRGLIPKAHPAAQAGALKAVEVIEDLIEAMPLWQDQFKIDHVLEVEEPFEYPDPEMKDVLWLGRPDRVVVSGRRIWHEQNRGLGSSVNFGTYLRLQSRSYHEHLYAEALNWKYGGTPRVGGTVFNLVRKLKFRTNAGKKNEAVKTAAEMFWQGAMAVRLDGGLHRSVMAALRGHVQQMQRVEAAWRIDGIIPPPNEKMNGGYGGNSEDPYFRVLIGEITLDDDAVFKKREDMYVPDTD